uniref:Uncharacterized protein n=1 Tax=Gallus gallus TaxID=9031 RepID=A0A8V0XDW1_CHICK
LLGNIAAPLFLRNARPALAFLSFFPSGSRGSPAAAGLSPPGPVSSRNAEEEEGAARGCRGEGKARQRGGQARDNVRWRRPRMRAPLADIKPVWLGLTEIGSARVAEIAERRRAPCGRRRKGGGVPAWRRS